MATYEGSGSGDVEDRDSLVPALPGTGENSDLATVDPRDVEAKLRPGLQGRRPGRDRFRCVGMDGRYSLERRLT
ncbi:hypothetical protein [Paenarthrobacter sp. NPDC057981]|uniref:hypothetical protein n=1 Tax=Paenarthrobacter sp. NPDC057981 TaxID=3346297 RepID=UPI0036DCBFEF